jgi:hypothetical protein
MRALLPRIFFCITTLAAIAPAQMHKVAKPEQVVRAVGVYEWTGDFAKPTASRLIPVSLYIEGQFQDAGIYIARPVPFALLSGNLYILQSAGVDKGQLDLAYAKHLQAVEATGDLAYDDGWFGYGSVKPLAAPRRAAALRPSKKLPVLVSSNKSTANSTASTATSDDSDRPTMKRRNSDTTSSGPATTPTSSTTASSTPTPADDPDRPTMTRRNPSSTSSDAGSTTASSTQSEPADDPDRPTMKRRDSSADTTTADTTSTASPTAPDDPDRPTLKRHTPEDAKKKNSANDVASVSGTGSSLNDDPNRPNLHHGKPTSAMTEADLPKLTGLPPDLHQMVAVSDAVNRDPHPFALAWDDEAQHHAILEKMQALARAQIAAYGSNAAITTHPPATKKMTTPANRSRRPAAASPPLQLLSNEKLNAYMLSYGGDPTYVYSADTGGTGAALRYVTIVAQVDSLGTLKPAIQSVTDAAHLDRTPRMSFVDVVDADASNRASLLFELRSQNVRQFALYRVIASHPEQIFVTGTTQ